MSQTCILDFGNTHVKWARFVDGEFEDLWRDEEAWQRLQHWHEEARWLVAASGPMDDRWSAWVEALKTKNLHAVVHLESAEGVPFPTSYRSMHTLGLDRIANAAAAAAEDEHADWLVIDAGTCITADLLEGGKFCGGSISPGIDLRLRAMFAGTASLPYPEDWRHQTAHGIGLDVGNDTVSALLAGAIGGAQAELTERIRRFRNEIPSIRVALTGGDAKFLQLQSDLTTFADPNLTWKGYYHLLNRMLTHE
jgi:type III pantothenate kinase